MNINNKKCPKCGESGNIDSKLFCHTCGTQLKFDTQRGYYSDDFVSCPECKQLNSNNVNFCTKCGSSLSANFVTLQSSSQKNRKGVFDGIHARFVAVGIALLLGVGLTWTYFGFINHASSGGPRIDVVFCIDTTGSMGDEIDNVKAQLQNMVIDIQKGKPRPVVRFGVVAYRDRGDDYVTKKLELTDNIQGVQEFINSLRAEGGGDHEESVNEALHVTVQGMNWDMSQGVSKMVFLIGDAGPHMDYANDYDYRKEIAVATKRNIMINAIGCSGIDTTAISIFQQMASTTNGAFDYLTYRQTCVNERGEEKVILYQGGKGYVVDDRYKSDTSWTTSGTRDLVNDKKAEVLSESIEPSTSGGVISAKDSSGSSLKTMSKPENNLGQYMGQQIINQAAKQQGSH